MKIEKGTIALLLAGLEILLILSSWIIGAAVPEANVKSLLGSEGIRWFFGHFVENLQTPLLVWIILLSVAYGSFRGSGLQRIFSLLITGKVSFASLHYRQRMGIRIAAIELLLIIIVIVLLTSIPHAILLSITGSLFPGSFSSSLIPTVSFTMIICSLSFGLSAGKQKNIVDTYNVLASGIRHAAPLFPIYILAIQLYRSLIFVFS